MDGMKRIGLIIGIFLIFGFLGYYLLNFVKNKVRHDLSQPIAYPSVTAVPTHMIEKVDNVTTSLFVPYWTLKDDIQDDNYTTFIYFGVSPGDTGINDQETGAKNVDEFSKAVPDGKKKLLTLRMIDTQKNFAILKDSAKQKKIIDQTVTFAKEHDFDGVVLDLELSAIPFDSLIKQINTFTSQFSTQAKKNNLTFSIAIYGDTFYRIRPFDVKTIAGNVDQVYVMAYDLHKSNGNPGPNFPLDGKELYGYTVAKMADDFLQFVPPKKMTVILGFFGYDWVVDAQGKAVEQGQPITYHEIQQKFLSNCQYVPCSIKRDTISSETEVRYTDEDGRHHIIWFEDPESAVAKQKYLKGRGISSFSFWANGYF